jgi:hypothetical protein
MKDYVKSSPYFFRRIAIAMALLFAVIAVLAAVFGAPLQEPAEPYNVPNPSKSAWFLLWMQELVSWNLHLVYLVVILFVGFLLAPFMVKPSGEAYAKWFDKRFTPVHVVTVLVFLFIVALTIVAFFFRVEYWQFQL